MSRISKFWILVLAVVPLYLTWTFDHSLWNPDETRDAGIAAEMYRNDRFAVPTLNGVTFLEKPPLYYWSCALIYKLTGRVTAGTTRLPSALYGILGVLFTFLIGKQLFNERIGLLAAMMLATTGQYFRMSHFAMMDVSLAALVAGALYFYIRGSNWGFALFTVLAFFSKGFLGVVLPGLVVTVDSLINRKPHELFKTIAIGAVVFAVLALPWFWALWKEGGVKNLEIFLIDNHWKRFVANGTDHTEHFWFYYFLSFPVDFLPWTLFFIPAVWSAYRSSSRFFEPGPRRLLAIWFLSLLAFFTMSSSKRSIYLLPIFPAAALLTAAWVEESASVSIRKVAIGLITGISLILGLSSFFAAQKLDQDKSFIPVYQAIREREPGKEFIGYDLNEMERGVFGFYLKRTFMNITQPSDLVQLVEQKKRPYLILVNRNKTGIVAPILEGHARVVFEFRPTKRARSYVLYESNP